MSFNNYLHVCVRCYAEMGAAAPNVYVRAYFYRKRLEILEVIAGVEYW